MKVLNKIIDFILPRFCTSCENKLGSIEQFICKPCLSIIEELSIVEIENEFVRKFSNSNIVDNYTSLFVFEENGKLQDFIRKWNVVLIIPIPLFHLKKIERGYNQADYIAKGLSKSLGIKYQISIAKRMKNTTSQTKLDSIERSNNMLDAFAIRKPKLVEGKNIIIVDDVITTGITVLELAKKLKENGANKVYALSVATPLISHTIGS
jgi:ComF family protein